MCNEQSIKRHITKQKGSNSTWEFKGPTLVSVEVKFTDNHTEKRSLLSYTSG
jgi:hypothetical protein